MRAPALVAAALLLSGPCIAAEPTRIVAFGTSLTASEHWQPALAGALDCAPVEIVTIAGAGMNSDWAFENLPRVITAKPSIALIEFSINDASLLHGLSGERSRANTIAIVEALRTTGIQPVLMTMNPAHGLRFFSRPWLADYYEIYRDVARERGLLLIDLVPVWEARPDLAADVPDGTHPTEAAAREVTATTVAEALRPLLCQDR